MFFYKTHWLAMFCNLILQAVLRFFCEIDQYSFLFQSQPLQGKRWRRVAIRRCTHCPFETITWYHFCFYIFHTIVLPCFVTMYLEHRHEPLSNYTFSSVRSRNADMASVQRESDEKVEALRIGTLWDALDLFILLLHRIHFSQLKKTLKL